MRRPMQPPPVPELLGLATPSRMVQIISTLAGVEDTYLHWDDLRHRSPPGDLSHEEWWLGLKLGRQRQYRQLPLVDSTGRPFVYTLPDAALRMLQRIERHASGSIVMPEEVTSPGRRDRYVMSSLIEEAITSSQLEGASTTRSVAKSMLQTGRAPRTRGETMIRNNYLAMHRVRELRNEPLTPSLVLELHRIVSAGTMRDVELEGALQQPDQERVVVTSPDDRHILHVPPPADQLPQRLQALADFANGEPERFLPPVVHAIVLHFQVGYDHPFEDGNGRTARAVFYWAMLHRDYWLAEFLTVSKILRTAPSMYARSFMLTETDENDLTYFILYHLDVICRAIDGLVEYVAHRSAELRDVRAILRHGSRLNHRQVDLLAHAVHHPDGAFTIDEHRRHHGVVYQTARTDLLGLVELDLLVRARRGKAHVFRPQADLLERLREL